MRYFDNSCILFHLLYPSFRVVTKSTSLVNYVELAVKTIIDETMDDVTERLFASFSSLKLSYDLRARSRVDAGRTSVNAMRAALSKANILMGVIVDQPEDIMFNTMVRVIQDFQASQDILEASIGSIFHERGASSVSSGPIKDDYSPDNMVPTRNKAMFYCLLHKSTLTETSDKLLTFFNAFLDESLEVHQDDVSMRYVLESNTTSRKLSDLTKRCNLLPFPVPDDIKAVKMLGSASRQLNGTMSCALAESLTGCLDALKGIEGCIDNYQSFLNSIEHWLLTVRSLTDVPTFGESVYSKRLSYLEQQSRSTKWFTKILENFSHYQGDVRDMSSVISSEEVQDALQDIDRSIAEVKQHYMSYIT